MIEIKDLLSKFDHLLLSEEEKKKTIGRIISEMIKIKINPEEIKIKNATVYLKIKPLYKNEILLKQEQIFLKLKESLGKKTPQNIC